MEILGDPLIFILVLVISFVYPNLSSPILTCGNNSFFIQYPFHLQQLENHKPHPNPFILHCNKQGIAVLTLPFSGEFYVRDIDYFGQKIRLYDPDNCLFGRLVNFSLSKSPFYNYAVTYQNYTLFSCPTERVGSRNLSFISCLSNSTASMLASYTNSSNLESNFTGCSVIISLRVPVSKIDQFEHEGWSTGDLFLGWTVPHCDEDCKAKARRKTVVSIIIVVLVASSFSALCVLFCAGCCLRFAALITEEIHQTPHTSDEGAPETYRFALPPSPGELSSPASVEIARQHEFSDDYLTYHSSDEGAPEMPPIPLPPSLGRLSSAIWVEAARQREFSDGFFTEDLIIGGGQCISGPNGDSCPICIEEYQPSERLRRICECDHCFHARCLETWLQKKTTCPVCRIYVFC